MLRFFLLGLVVMVGVYKTEACTYLGKQHAMGDVWTAADGCNQCVCGIVGSICTKQICVDTPPKTTPPPPTKTAPTTTANSARGAAPCVVFGTEGMALTYKDGESFPSPDGCNKCMCRNGNALCTLMMCVQKPQCTDASSGKTYAVGQRFPSSDGCNTCQCFDGGISCTKMFCTTTTSTTTHAPIKQNVCTGASGTIHKDGESFKSDDGCNTCTCMNGMAACTEMACMKMEQCFDRFTLSLHNNGESFKAPDGCNTCKCSSGTISCTKTVC